LRPYKWALYECVRQQCPAGKVNYWAVDNGIMNGKGGDILDPKGFATRAQVAQMLMNYMMK